jgi:GT2 family glycosyltransferase
MSADRVSIVVITHNRRAELLGSLARLQTLPERPPVIVVDNASTDGTRTAVAAQFPSVTVLDARRNLGAAGRNLGVALATTPYVAFSDDDSWWEPGSLQIAADLLDRYPRLAVVAARVLVGESRSLDATCALMASSPITPPQDTPGTPVLGFIACGAVVRASAFFAVGGFDEMLQVGGEEQLLAMDLAAAGWALAYVPDVLAVHTPSLRRDRVGRRHRVIRNELWQAWLRRRWSSAARTTSVVAWHALGDATARKALGEALRAAPTIVRRRRALPIPIEHQMRAVERLAPRSW